MKGPKILAVAVLFVVVFELPAASAADCRSKITTVENMLASMKEDGETLADARYPGSEFWRIDVPAAQEHLGEAKAYLADGQELNCQLHVFDALRRLGVEL